MNQLNFARLYYFYQAACLGSQAAAARALRVTQSTISEQIKVLEGELRTDLFVRRGPSLSLTDAGRKALEHAEIIFGTGERLLRELDVSVATRTVLEIGVAATVSRSLAADLFLPLFAEEEICPRIAIADFGALYPRLCSGEIHILVSEVEPRGKGSTMLKTTVAHASTFAIVAAPGTAADVTSTAALHSRPWIHYTTSCGYRWPVDAELRTNHVVPNIVAETDDLALMRLATIRGYGFAAIPEQFVAADIKDGRLVRVGAIEEPIPLYVSHIDEGLAEFVSRAVHLLTRTPA